MFAGWYENSDLSGSPVGVVQLGTTIDKTFYAKWKKDIGSNIASSYIYTGFNTVNDTFFESLDIINIAFSIANSSGELTGTTLFNNVQTHIMPKAKLNGNWVILSIAPESAWTTFTATQALRETFVNNIVNAINTYGFDGVDIDWEYPIGEAETLQYTLLMQEVYSKVKANNPYHLVTTAIAGGMWQVSRYDLLNSLQYIDYINVMIYDMSGNAGQYQNPLYKRTGFHDDLNKVGSTLTSTSLDESVKLFKNTYNVPYSKMIIGIPFYGVRQTRSYSGGTWSNWSKAGTVLYHNIINNYLSNNDYTYYFDEVSKVPYLLKNDGSEFISYENYESTILKAEYVVNNNLAGMMFWQYGGDNTGSLLAAIYDVLKS